MKKEIYVKTSFSAFHRWSNAPEEVAFLRNLHRHVFYVKVGFEVTDSDREVEFFIAQGNINKVIRDSLLVELSQNPEMSCEMMCIHIGNSLTTEYLSPKYVEVSEDGENGAIICLD